MKRHLIAAFLAVASVPALAQTPDSSTTPPASGSQPSAEAPKPAETPQEAPKEAPKKEAASSWTDKVKLGAKAYLRYSYELGEEAKNAKCRARCRWIAGAISPRRTWAWRWADRCPRSSAAST